VTREDLKYNNYRIISIISFVKFSVTQNSTIFFVRTFKFRALLCYRIFSPSNIDDGTTVGIFSECMNVTDTAHAVSGVQRGGSIPVK
jgi:hypothetical protein